MNLLAFGYLACSMLCLVMASFVLGRHERSATRDAFLTQVIIGFVWQAGTFFVLTARDEVSAAWIAKAAYSGCIFLSCASYHLVVNFLKLDGQRQYVKAGYIIGAAVFLPMLTTDLLISGVHYFPWGFWFTAGPLHPVFLAYFVFFGLLALGNLLTRVDARLDKTERDKHRLVLYGYLLSYLSVVDFFPDYGHSVLPLGFLFSNLWLLTIWFVIKFYDFFSIWRKII